MNRNGLALKWKERQLRQITTAVLWPKLASDWPELPKLKIPAKLKQKPRYQTLEQVLKQLLANYFSYDEAAWRMMKAVGQTDTKR